MPHVHSRTAVRPRTAPRRGFALLITITLLAFLVLLLVSLASLTRVETQVAGNNQQLAQARQNALMALNIALGQLQKYAGPDQRVTAPASFAIGVPAAQTSDTQKGLVTPAAGAQQWLGVWGNSSAANDIYGATPTPVLLNWLVSGNEQTSAPAIAADGHITSSIPTLAYKPNLTISNLSAASKASDTNITIDSKPAVLLVGPNSAGTTTTPANRFIAAPLVSVKSTNVAGLGGASTTVGRYAYWIGDEGVKAQYNLRDKLTAVMPPTDPSTASADARYRLRTPARDAIELLSGFSGYTAVNPAAIDSVKVTNQLRLADTALTPANQQLAFHDITTSSWGVLANTQTGGLRTDLTHALSQGSLGTNFGGKTIIPAINGSTLTTTVPNGPVNNTIAPDFGPKWETLKSFADLSTAAGNSAAVEVRPATATTAGISPVLTQARMALAMDTVPKIIQTEAVPRRFFVCVIPVFIISNPYSFPIKATDGVDFSYAITTHTQSEWGISLDRRDTRNSTTSDVPPFDRAAFSAQDSIGGGHKYFPILINTIDGGAAARSVLGNVRFQTPTFTLAPGASQTFTMADGFIKTSAANSTGDDVPLVTGTGSSNNPGYYRFDTGADVGAHTSASDKSRWGYFLRHLVSKAMTIQMAVHNSPALDGSLTQPQTGALQTIINADLSVSNGPKTSSGPNGTGNSAYAPPPRPYAYTLLYPNVTLPYTFGGYHMSLALPILDTDLYKENAGDSITWIGTHRPYADYNLTARNFALPPVAPLLTPSATAVSNVMETVPPYTRRYPLGPKPTNAGIALDLSSGKIMTGISPPLWGYTTKSSGAPNSILYDAPKGTTNEAAFFSIGQLQHADLTGDDIYLSVSYQPRYAVGNSWCNPYVLRTKTVDSRPKASPQHGDSSATVSGNVRMFDLSYLMNTALWDSYFFSSLRQTGDDIGKPANQRLAFAGGYIPTSAQLGIGAGDTKVTDLSGNGAQILPEMTAARYMMIKGAFNINSTSVDAWKAALAGARSLAMNGDSTGTPFARSLSQTLSSQNADDGQEDSSYAGYRRLTDAQITTLATQIVDQVRQRGPFVSLAHFINRVVAPASDTNNYPFTTKGALQTAIEAANLNPFSGAPDLADINPTTAYAINGEPNLGNRSAGAPGWLTQADILQSIGSTLSARSDTFTVRVYGDVINPLDQTTVVARAWCEATVQRFPDYVDTTDSAASAPTKSANTTFGRKFRVISFRWLSDSDI